MAEEVNKVEGEVVKPAETVVEKTYTEAEEKALAKGWKPEEEFDGPKEQFRSAREFLDRGELLDKIKDQSRELKKVTDIVSSLSEQNRQVYIAGYRRALAELQKHKAEAITDRDPTKLAQVENAIDQTKEAIRQVQAAPAPTQQVGETQAFKDFKETNSWYNDSSALRKWAHSEAGEFVQNNPNASEEQVYAYIEKQVKKEFPEKFTKRSNGAPPSPDSEGRGTKTVSGNKSGSFEKLLSGMPEDQAKVARDMVKRGYITKEKYVEDYEAIGR